MTSKAKFENYLAIELAGGASWHPDGKQIAFTSNASGQFQIYICEVSKGKTMPRKQITNEDDRCTDPRYLPDGTLLFKRDRGGDENFQLGLVDENEVLHWLTSDFDAKYLPGLITESYLYFCANLNDRARFDVYRWKLPLLENKPEVIHEPTAGLVQVTASSEDENFILMTQFIGNMDRHILLLNIETMEVDDLTSELCGNLPTRWEVVRWIDEENIIVVTDYESDIKRLGVLKISKQFVRLEDFMEKIDFEIEDQFAYSKDSIWTYFIENQEGYTTIHRAKFTKDTVSDHEVLSFPIRGVVPSGDSRSWIFALSLSPDEHMLAVTLSSGVQPTNVWIVSIRDMTSWPATQVSIAGIDPSTFIEPTLHRFESFDSLSVPYFRFIPNGDIPRKGWPAIFLIHGGPESQIRPDFNPVIQFFLASGFAIIAPNIRGSDGYGRKYLDLDNIEKRLDSINDIRYLAFHIKKNDEEINGDCLIIYGGSYGGFAVLSSMTEYPDIWRAGVDLVGISNFVTFLQNTAAWRQPLRECEYGSLADDMDTLIRISPIHKVDKIAAPLFIIQGDNDERVPLSESIQIYEKLKEKGLEVRMMRFADEGHGLAKLENKIKAYTEVLHWLKDIIESVKDQ
ncbi:S9 family peptidase [Candidatus Thorarchaeota archaeon]|nr:MAG: S9 family peptidase [Candidatus Thorarchaeota archaeon]